MGTRHCGRRRAEHTPVVKTTATTVYTGTVRGTEVHIAMYNFSDKVVAAPRMPGNVALGAIAAALLIVAGVACAVLGVRQRERRRRDAEWLLKRTLQSSAAVQAATAAGFSIEIVLSVLAAYFGAQPRASTVDEASLLAMLRASQRRQHLDDDPRRRSVPAAVMRLLARSRGDARGEVPTAAVRLELARRQRIVAAEAHIAPLRARLSEALGDEAAAEVAGLVAIGVALREEAMSAPLLPPPPRQLWWASSTRKMNGGRGSTGSARRARNRGRHRTRRIRHHRLHRRRRDIEL